MSRPCLVCQADNSAFLCKPCLSEVRRVIAELPSLRHEVSLLATGQTRVYRANGRPDPNTEIEAWDAEEKRIPAHLRSKQGRVTLPTTASMVNTYARDLLTEADNTLVTWARHLAEARGLTLAVTNRGELDGWLLTNLDTIRWDEAADQIHRDLTRLRHRMTRAIDRAPSRIYAGPCEADMTDGQKCRAQLYTWPPPRFEDDPERARWEDANPIQCDGYRPPFTDPTQPGNAGCGQNHHRDDRRSWLLADIEDRLLPLSLLQDALPGIASHLAWPKRSTWWKWTRETESGHRLLHPRTVIDGVEFFRGGDVVDLVTRQQKRIIGNTENHRTHKTRDRLELGT